MKICVCNYGTIRYSFETYISGSPNTSLDNLNQKGRQVSPSSSLTLSLDRSGKFMYSSDITLDMVGSIFPCLMFSLHHDHDLSFLSPPVSKNFTLFFIFSQCEIVLLDKNIGRYCRLPLETNLLD